MLTLSPREAELFYILLTLKRVRTGTIHDICRQIAGSSRSGSTHRFVKRMIFERCLVEDGERIHHNGRRYPTFARDKGNMKDFYEKTIYFHTANSLYVIVDKVKL